MKKAKLLWMDLEMTGLVPGEDRILEMACIATDWKLNELGQCTGVVRVPEKLMRERMTGDFWEKNSETCEALINQNEFGRKGAEIEQELLDFVEKHFKGEVILAGNSIHQDRKFIDLEWPKLAEKLHYRMLDVSAWKVYFEGARKQKFTKREAHRALDDIRGSIEELSWYLTFLKGGQKGCENCVNEKNCGCKK